MPFENLGVLTKIYILEESYLLKMTYYLFSSHVILYFTAKHGLSEFELEDILSCDDDVLNDVYKHWTPPTRRIPPLLIVRLRYDLGQFLGNYIYNILVNSMVK